MSNYIKLPKTELDDVERTRSGPTPYEIPNQHQEVEVQKENKPSRVEATDTVVTPTDSGEWEADVPLNSSETWEQFRSQIRMRILWPRKSQ
jgi:hypothetical protein